MGHNDHNSSTPLLKQELPLTSHVAYGWVLLVLLGLLIAVIVIIIVYLN
jgi:hypothetical protein